MNRTDTLLRLKRFRVDEMKRRISTIDAMRWTAAVFPTISSVPSHSTQSSL